VEAVDCFSGDADGGIEAESNDRPPHVVVNSLGNANNRHPLGSEAVGDVEAAVAADGNEGIEVEAAEVVHDPVGNVALLAFAGNIADRHHEWIALVG